MEPKIAIIGIGPATYIFFNGRHFNDLHVEDFTYKARDKDGNLHPTIEMKLNLEDVPQEKSISFDEFLKKIGYAQEDDSAQTEGTD